MEKNGTKIKKLSIVGYSLGGLVARYTIGLLYSKGWFKRIKPVNFTTFATPHLGVKTPLLGVQYTIFNFLGSRTLSASGRQLFQIDTFRDTNRPILSVLADPESIFMLALAQFSHRVLYANIVNDRSAPYYTTRFVPLESMLAFSRPEFESRDIVGAKGPLMNCFVIHDLALESSADSEIRVASPLQTLIPTSTQSASTIYPATPQILSTPLILCT